VLRLLAVNDETKTQIGEEKGVEALLKMAKAFPKSTTVQADVAGALAVLAVDDALEAAIAQGGGIELLLAALQQHPEHPAVVAHAWHALTNLSVSADNKARVSKADIKALIGNTLKKHAEAPRVVEGVATTLRNLCLGAEPSSFVDADTCEKLLQLLKSYTPQTIVALAIAGAVRAVTVSPGLASQMAAKGGHEVLNGVLSESAQNKYDDRLKKEVESALRRLDAAQAGEGMDSRASVAEMSSTKGEKTRLPGGMKQKQKEVGSLKDGVVSLLTPKGKKDKKKSGKGDFVEL